MRKILLIISIFVISTFFVGCSAQHDGMNFDEPTLYSSLSFNFDTMRFTTTNNNDILQDKGDPFIDFTIVYTQTQVTTLEGDVELLYQQLFTKFKEMNVQSIGRIYQFSSEEFRNQADDDSITLVPIDIIMFNQYKQLMAEIIEQYPFIYISKIDYLEQQLDRTLSTTEIEDIELLQSYYYTVKQDYSQFDFKRDSYEDFITRVETITNAELSEADKESLSNGFTILEELN